MMRLGRLGAAASAAAAAGVLVLGTVLPSYADDGDFVTPDSGGGGIPGAFVVLFVIAAILAVGGFVWRVTTAQRIAREAGMDPGLATQMTMLSDDGLDATYLAASLRGTQQPTSPSTAPASGAQPVAARLAELKGLLDGGLITQAEYDERRKAIIDSV